ncbi:endonuclease/exonuclease/phosphatase family protein [Alcanivorax jadensis]|uniref:endonuclease/exonuclease/phosphatase family protein n=1 Tax=Alcanivorax jadensis TaxID=64988 RepID=UPI003567B330
MRHLLIIYLFLVPLVLPADCRNLAPAQGVPAPQADEWTLATLNLWRLRDTRKDSRLDEPLSAAVLNRRIQALADFIAGPLQAPHMLAVQEVENRELLEKLTARLARKGHHYRVVLKEGNDPSGMDVGLLYRQPVRIASVSRLFAEQGFHGHSLFSRPPLRVTVQDPRQWQLVIVHLRSARGLHKPQVHGKRQSQAALLANWVGEQDGPLVMAGDFNTTWDAGRFSASYERFAESGLFNLWQRLPEPERYSFRHRCRPQALDHIWVSADLKMSVSRVAASRGNVGRYDSLYGSQGVAPVSDHDALVVYFSAKK